MKRKAKWITIILSSLATCCVAFFAGCTSIDWVEQQFCDHTFDSGVVTRASTCTREGELTKTCTECGATETVAIGKSLHTAETVASVSPTCTQSGKSSYVKCSVCDEIIVPASVLPAQGHQIVAVEGTPATCLTSGLTNGSECSVCGFIQTEQTVIPATGHTVVTIEGTPATCYSEGLTNGQYCSVCSEVFVEQTTIPVTVHNVVDGVCTYCNSVYEEVAVTKGELVAGNWYRLYRNDVSTMSHLYLSGDNNNGNLCVNNYSEYYNSTYFCSGPCYYLEGMETVITDEYIDMYLAVGTYNVLSTSSGSSTGKTVTIDETTTITSFTDGYVYRLDCFEHQLETVAEKAATCTELGWNEHQGCKNCGYTENYVEIPATGHSDEDADNVCDDCGFDMTKLLEVATVDGELVAGNWYRAYFDSYTFSLSGFEDGMYFYIMSSGLNKGAYLWVSSLGSGPMYYFEGMQVNVTDEYVDFYFEEGTYNIVKNDGTATDLTYTIDETTTLVTAYSWLYRLENYA